MIVDRVRDVLFSGPVAVPSAASTRRDSAQLLNELEAGGLWCSGTSPDNRLVEFIELPGHPFWVGTQAHPEFKSRPDRPHPLFREFVAASLDRRRRGASTETTASADSAAVDPVAADAEINAPLT